LNQRQRPSSGPGVCHSSLPVRQFPYSTITQGSMRPVSGSGQGQRCGTGRRCRRRQPELRPPSRPNAATAPAQHHALPRADFWFEKFLGEKKTGGVISSRNPAENKSDINEFFDVVSGRSIKEMGDGTPVPGFPFGPFRLSREPEPTLCRRSGRTLSPGARVTGAARVGMRTGLFVEGHP
jgi:hypothetical protein